MKTPTRKTEVVAPATLKTRRLTLGLTAADISDMTGLGEAEVILLEGGRLPGLPRDRWQALCAALRLQESRPTSTLLPPLATARGQGLATAPQRKGLDLGERPPLDGGPPMPDGAAWWQRLRIQRQRLGLGLTEALKWSGVRAATIRAFEAGAYPLTPQRLDAWRAVAAGLSLVATLPPLPALTPPAWAGWSVSGRGTSTAQAQQIRWAQARPADSPGSMLLMARLRNGWSVRRTARAIAEGRSSGAAEQAVETAEALSAWPSMPSSDLRALCKLWRVVSPVRYLDTATEQRRTTYATIAERLTAQAEAGSWTRADLCDVAALSPLALDDVLLGRADRGRRYWHIVDALTRAGFNLLDGLAVPSRLAYAKKREGEEGEGEPEGFDVCDDET